MNKNKLIHANEYLIEMKKIDFLMDHSGEFLFNAKKNADETIPYLQISVASLFLRKSIEVLIFSTLVMDREKYKLEKESSYWNIKYVIKAIEKINPNWFPVPITIEDLTIKSDDLSFGDLKEKENNTKIFKAKIKWINKEDNEDKVDKNILIEYYDYLSGFIHYENHLSKERKNWNDKSFINDTISKLYKIEYDIKNLIKIFSIQLPNDDTIYIYDTFFNTFYISDY
ncbi:MAG: hypothetical protein ACRDCF_00125 [Mycoplasmoidaceae bacterium]